MVTINYLYTTYSMLNINKNQNSKRRQKIMGNNVRQIVFTFHNAETAISDGAELNIGAGHVLMNIAVTGDAVGFNLVFEGKANDTDDYTPIMCANLATLALASNATANGKVQVSLEGLVKFRCRLSVIAGNAVSVRGTVVN